MIIGIFGDIGEGKTYSMIRYAIEWMMRDRLIVYSNMAMLCIPNSIYMGELTNIQYLASGLLLLDEVNVCMNSRQWGKLSPVVGESLNQSRKEALHLIYTAQKLGHVDPVLRARTHRYYLSRQVMGRAFYLSRFDPDEKRCKADIKIYRKDARYFPFYDTYERISADGSGGRIGAAARLQQARLLAKQGSGRIETGSAYLPKFGKCPLLWRGNRAYLSPVAKEAKEYLHLLGMLGQGGNDLEMIAQEVERRSWLALCGLAYDDLPIECTPRNPWLPGCSPADHREECADFDLRNVIETIADLVEVRQNRKV